jgi:hypothetical protein
MHLRVDATVMQEVRAYARDHGISIAAAVSILLRAGLRG